MPTGMTAAIAAAAALPVRSGSVDLLTCRYAFHHMVDAERVLGEFRRVMTDDGSFLLADTVATEDPVVYEWMDKVERLRDPSHHLNRSPSELLALIEGCGFRVTDTRNVAGAPGFGQLDCNARQHPQPRSRNCRRC